MPLKTIISAVVLLLAIGGVVAVFVGQGDGGPAAANAEGLPDDGVVVYYFHGFKRCQTCQKMERLADEAVAAAHPDLVRRGRVVFRSVNLETDATRHFVDDYQLSSKVVVISERRDGREVSWRRLDEVWDRIADDADYRQYIAGNVTECVREMGLVSS
ncbi:MAG: nitrophenyl compound nitroreductase subunit ArsF family protein [Candidatus Krumholzibacteriia bacterium]